MTIRQNEIWRDKNTGAKYRILQVEKDLDGSVLNVKIQNTSNDFFGHIVTVKMKNKMKKLK